MQCISAFFQRGQQLKMLKLSSEGLRIQMDRGRGGQGFVDSSRARCFLFFSSGDISLLRGPGDEPSQGGCNSSPPTQLLSGSDLRASTGKCVLATLLQPVFLSRLSTSHLFLPFLLFTVVPGPLNPGLNSPFSLLMRVTEGFLSVQTMNLESLLYFSETSPGSAY